MTHEKLFPLPPCSAAHKRALMLYSESVLLLLANRFVIVFSQRFFAQRLRR